ncbi:MAG TPA: isocitrate lyase/PEP mutase family protein [Rhizomicrobium sp.]|nr:isocitrate lyase/PEP mutase family protein [Rhizomicrobium sp.]
MNATLDSLLASGKQFIVPGAYDALSAKIAARAGAQIVYMTGFGVVGASFAVPDIGLIGPEQMTERVRALAAACAPVPLLADGDNGHGGPNNVARLVRGYEQAGAQGIQLEDQVSPKRCGHMEGKEVVPLADAVAKIRAAVAARSSPAFKILARTDACSTHGFDEALRRAHAFADAGADILFVEAPRTEAELARVPKEFAQLPTLANMVEDGKTPELPPAVLFAMGYRIALRPISALLAVGRTLERAYAELLANGATSGERLSFAQYNAIVGLEEAKALDGLR